MCIVKYINVSENNCPKNNLFKYCNDMYTCSKHVQREKVCHRDTVVENIES